MQQRLGTIRGGARTALAILVVAMLTAPAFAQSPALDFAAMRAAMVETEIAAAGVTNPRVLESMRTTPRHEFMPATLQEYAYVDAALPIGERQTISPPFIVAFMTQALDPQPTDRVLEIGTGSGYQAAVLSPLVKDVYTIEIVERLGRRAELALRRLGYENVSVRIGDGYQGWAEHAPFDKIIVTCSPESIPEPLVEQLRDGGQMIIPVGQRYQQMLYRITKRGTELVREPLEATLFVPMTGAAEDEREVLPDPLKPTAFNGDFEQVVGETDRPAGWHYLRQAALVADGAPQGKQFLRFTNEQAGRGSQALQGFAIDGRKVSQLKISCRVRGENLNADANTGSAPAIVVTFFDERRGAIEEAGLGPWSGNFAWKRESTSVDVPLAAREAILAIGLHGATGQLDLDDVRIEAAASD
jgi:protein-L-isoaspartate(D-aspartate) O-methyltransferase